MKKTLKEGIKSLVRDTAEETLNNLLDFEAEEHIGAKSYERSHSRKGYRSGHYSRKFDTSCGTLNIKIPKLKGIAFQTAVLERYRCRESSIEEALIEMYLAGVSTRRMEKITELLWGGKVSAGTISSLNKKGYRHIEEWRNRPIDKEYPYVYADGIYLKREWGGSYESVAVLVAIGVDAEGNRQVLGAEEGMKEDRESWRSFFRRLKERGLGGVRLVIGDKNIGLAESIAEHFPHAKYQRCMVHFQRNVMSAVPKKREREAAMEKGKQAAERLRSMSLVLAAKRLEEGLEETLTFMEFPSQHWLKIRTNNMLERLNREIRRRTNAIGAFPDGKSALMLVSARLRHIEGAEWGTAPYMNMKWSSMEAEKRSVE